MTKWMQPELTCKCGFIGSEYTIEQRGVHSAAICPNCNEWIKNLSKSDKYGTKERQGQIWEKTKGRCCYCGTKLNPFKKNGYTYEHMESQHLGGGHESANLWPCCKSCNSQKGKKSLKEYRQYMKGKSQWPTYIFYFEVCRYSAIGDILKNIF